MADACGVVDVNLVASVADRGMVAWIKQLDREGRYSGGGGGGGVYLESSGWH